MVGDEHELEPSRLLLVVTVILSSSFAMGVVFPIDATLGIKRFTGISFANFPRILLVFLALIPILGIPLFTRRWLTPRTTVRERRIVFVVAAVGGFVAFYAWKATMALLIRTAPTLIPVVIFGISLGLIYLFREFQRVEQVSQKRKQWFARSKITLRDIRHPRRIIAGPYKRGHVFSLIFNLIMFVGSGIIFLTSVTTGTLSSTILTLTSVCLCLLYGKGVYELMRQRPL